MNKASPMIEQFKAIKSQHPDKLLLFQVGDFFELFFEDARIAARELEIALTSRGTENDEPIPLAGVPIHAVETYLNKLLGKGHKVVICEQVEEASQSKGLVRRAITRILTPGTITDPKMLEESRNNYLAVLAGQAKNCYGLAVVDVSTGDFKVTEQSGDDAFEAITDELFRLMPSECLCSSEDILKSVQIRFNQNNKTLVEMITHLPAAGEARELIAGQWGDQIWEQLNLSNYSGAALAAAAALEYLQMLHHPQGMKHFHPLELYFSGTKMLIDTITSRNLELTQSLREGTKKGSLLELLDHCMTAMGKRLLRRWIEQPLISTEQIESRYDALTEFISKPLKRRELRNHLQSILDLERFSGRLSYRNVNARDLISLKNSLKLLRPLKDLLNDFNPALIKSVNNNLPDFGGLVEVIENALVEEPPLNLKEGGLFRAGYNDEVDELKLISSDGNSRLVQMEQNERERTGIKTMRVGYNRNFGYYFEVTRANLALVPPEYQRRQTLVNAERFTTGDLQEMEQKITGAREKLTALEYSLFEELREKIATYIKEMTEAAYQLAFLDCLQGLAEAAERQHYIRPSIVTGGDYIIKNGRHPVVEALSIEKFVPNDIVMNKEHYVLLITGPNMAGKSTYIRSAALISIMAQMGSFVPADSATLPVVDRIFARVGASDDLSRGQSTFMVEMQETAAILNEATSQSLVILDEIGRGTSTYDGMSIARSVLEYIGTELKPKTLFSTHYHELTNLEGDLPGIKNYTMAVKERGRQVIFLRRIIPGKADKSYGINVARLAGVPLAVLVRAEEVLAELELNAHRAGETQLSFLPLVSKPLINHVLELDIAGQLKDLDLNRLTPLEAIQKLYEMQSLLLEHENSLDDKGDD